ncbi:MAG TPA: hypothetical protein VGC56_17870 [Allosphingosinicella sp.]|jgi:hypothetical protein
MGSGRVRARASVALGGSAAAKRARVRWSVELGERFLALVRESGNARVAAAALGAPHAFNNKMKRDAGFRARVMAAVAEADARLAGAESAFLPDGGGSEEPPPPCFAPRLPCSRFRLSAVPRTADPPTPPSPSRGGAEAEPSSCRANNLGGFLRPGRKRAQVRPEPVIRRNSRGRYQVTFARDGHWTADIEADFLARLAASGNFDASAKAVGFAPASVHERVRKWAAFKEACDEALEAADARLGYRLVAHAHALLRPPGEALPEGEEEVPFDPKAAMQILGFLDARKSGRTRRGPRTGPPDRSFDEAVESVLAKIEAIEKHDALIAREAAEKEAGE